MKRFYLLTTMLLVFSIKGQNVVHFSLHSHNEIQDAQAGITYTVKATYDAVKAVAYKIKDTVQKYGVKWNMQVESNLILACIKHDSAFYKSNDFIQTMETHSLIEVDPHNHINLAAGVNYNPYNYADVAHLLDSCGLSTRTNVGGFLYKAADWTYTVHENWPNWKNGLVGNSFPSYTWTPTTLWGGGTPGHVDDYNAFGVWRPAGTSSVTFGSNSSTGLINIGNGCEKWSIEDTTNITGLLARITPYINYCYSAPTQTNTYYAASATMNFRGFLGAKIVDSVSKFIRAMNNLKLAGKITWETMSETRTNWMALHPNPNDNFVIRCKNIALGIDEMDLVNFGFGMYPNPTSRRLQIIANEEIDFVEVLDLNGRTIKLIEIKAQETQVDISDIAPGIYFVGANGKFKKLIKE